MLNIVIMITSFSLGIRQSQLKIITCLLTTVYLLRIMAKADDDATSTSLLTGSHHCLVIHHNRASNDYDAIDINWKIYLDIRVGCNGSLNASSKHRMGMRYGTTS